jgi:hypothetical protein
MILLCRRLQQGYPTRRVIPHDVDLVFIIRYQPVLGLSITPLSRAFYPLQTLLALVCRPGNQQLTTQLVLGLQITGSGLSVKIIEGIKTAASQLK